MRPDPHYLALEPIVARQLAPLLTELRMTDLVTFVDLAVNGREAIVGEIVTAAAELHFAPGFIGYAGGADVAVDWTGSPSVVLGVRIAAARFDARVKLTIGASAAIVELQHLRPTMRAHAPGGQADSRQWLEREFAHNRLVPTRLDDRPTQAG